ncbi:MAG: right-handed parallel beta-helix repeat-containing protein, partial [Candidatus Thermoplasmatota archaeon]
SVSETKAIYKEIKAIHKPLPTVNTGNILVSSDKPDGNDIHNLNRDNIIFEKNVALISFTEHGRAIIIDPNKHLLNRTGEKIIVGKINSIAWWSMDENTFTMIFGGSLFSPRGYVLKGPQIVIAWDSRGFAKAPQYLDNGFIFIWLKKTNVLAIPLQNSSYSGENRKLIEGEIPDTQYIPHDPIYINGNNQFTPTNGVSGGSGTIEDPYIIEGWEISASTAVGIRIENTTAYFIIRNCYIHGWRTFNGIHLGNVKNGKIKDCIIQDTDSGISLFGSRDNIVENISSYNNVGIYLLFSTNNKINGCTLSKDLFFGILFSEASLNEVTNNSIENTSIGVMCSISSFNNFKNNIIKDCTIGIVDYLSIGNTYNYNAIEGNDDYGFLGINCITDATNNWWGHESGPSGRGPGKGDKIDWIYSIVYYTPWLTSPP